MDDNNKAGVVIMVFPFFAKCRTFYTKWVIMILNYILNGVDFQCIVMHPTKKCIFIRHNYACTMLPSTHTIDNDSQYQLISELRIDNLYILLGGFFIHVSKNDQTTQYSRKHEPNRYYCYGGSRMWQ